ncbi:excitatory amino acid transporter-like [Mya arenaria]|uniref:excitatory amino acid transporter-like n=1 Tax=Mya arenaria TaxID=6604 RepID=UPI0022E166DF|nr:excitatory amino acid transporter-like [Mya arenaria]XP_052782347.1 excitatory amino acid transporter-like [Mya arenaria]
MTKETSSLTTGQPVHHASSGPREPMAKRACLRVVKGLMDNLLLFTTLFGVIFGFVLGFAVRPSHPSEEALMWIGLPGQLYLRLLKMMIIPLIGCSVICGAAALDPKANGKISLIALVFIISTNALGSAMGIGSVYMFNPGKGEERHADTNIEGNMQTGDILADLIRNIIPDNLFEATFAQTQTKYKIETRLVEVNTTDGIKNETMKTTKRYLGKMDNANIIGLIFACTLLGLAAAGLKEKGKPFLDFISSVSDTVIVVVRWFMWTTPVGVISLIGVSIASIDSVQDVFAQLGLFIAAITVGIAVQQLVVMCAIFFVFTRQNPYKFLLSIARPWMIAFAATSTAVAIPEMIAACEGKNNIDKRVARFVIPFSVTISCNGSAMYIAGATCFVANLTGTPLNIADGLLIWLLVTISAMAIPSVPSASIMTTIMVLSSMNIPAEDIALLLAIEWYLDRLRSTSSVVSHTICTAVVYSLCKGDLDKIDEKHHMPRNETDVTIVIDNSAMDDDIKLNGKTRGSTNGATLGGSFNSMQSSFGSSESSV